MDIIIYIIIYTTAQSELENNSTAPGQLIVLLIPVRLVLEC